MNSGMMMRLFEFAVLVVCGFVSSIQKCDALLTAIPQRRHRSQLRKHNILHQSTEATKQRDNESASVQYKPLFDAIQNARLDDDNAHRVFHGRGRTFDGCDNLTMDVFPPVCLLTSHLIELNDIELEEIGKALESRWSQIVKERGGDELELNWIYQHRPEGNSPATTVILKGDAPKRHVVVENGMKFFVRLMHSQNHGIFLDMANGREWVKRNAANKSVLNLFAYTCGFSIAALVGGASQVVNIDMAKGPLKLGQQNHGLNGIQDRVKFLPHDIFKSWGKLRKSGPYDMIIADPPSFQRNSFVAKKDYAKLVRRFPDMLSPDGVVVLCLNAPELSSAWLQEQVAQAAPSLEFVERVQNPDSFPAKDPDRALKVLIYKKRSEKEAEA